MVDSILGEVPLYFCISPLILCTYSVHPNPDIFFEHQVQFCQKMEGGESGQSHFVDPQSTQEVSKTI